MTTQPQPPAPPAWTRHAAHAAPVADCHLCQQSAGGTAPDEPVTVIAQAPGVTYAIPDDSEDDDAAAPFFMVAPYLVWRQCGGPEEGGWYYDAGEPALEAWLPAPVVCKTRAEAREAQGAMQAALDADANVGLRDKYSVLSDGVYEAHVTAGYPHAFPVERPFYE